MVILHHSFLLPPPGAPGSGPDVSGLLPRDPAGILPYPSQRGWWPAGLRSCGFPLGRLLLLQGQAPYLSLDSGLTLMQDDGISRALTTSRQT